MKNLITALFMTIVTTVLLGLIYPLIVTGLAQVIFPDQANGSLIRAADGTVIGSRLIGQPFSSPGYFWSRPSPPGAAEFQVPRVARERGLSEAEIRRMVAAHTAGRQFGFLGEPRVSVLELN